LLKIEDEVEVEVKLKIFVGVRLPTSLFYIERDPHSRTEIGERDTLIVHKNEATVAWPEAIARHKPRRQSGVIKANPPLS
jgi:hypothetical protein